MYKCIIWSNSSHEREYDVETRSAYQATLELGRCEGSEVVEIRTAKTGRRLSRAQWTPEDGGKYYRVTIWHRTQKGRPERDGLLMFTVDTQEASPRSLSNAFVLRNC